MPRTTVYIRNDDLEKWKLIENKAELISQAINRSVITPVIKKNGTVRTKQEVINPTDDTNPVCKKHGLPVLSGRNVCGMKDCK